MELSESELSVPAFGSSPQARRLLALSARVPRSESSLESLKDTNQALPEAMLEITASGRWNGSGFPGRGLPGASSPLLWQLHTQ